MQILRIGEKDLISPWSLIVAWSIANHAASVVVTKPRPYTSVQLLGLRDLKCRNCHGLPWATTGVLDYAW